MKRSLNNNLAAKSQKGPRRLSNLAADALVRAGGKSSTMRQAGFPNNFTNSLNDEKLLWTLGLM